MTESSDIALIRAFGKGDEYAFELLYHRYRRQLYGFLNNLIGNDSGEVDEVFEETWLRVIDKLPQYRDEGRFSAWLFRMARNIFIDRWRRNRLLTAVDPEEFPETIAPPGSSPTRELDLNELSSVIGAAVSRLPEEQREVFLLRQQDLAFEEIAEVQGCSINTVLSRMQYALKNLRKFIAGIDRGGLLE